MKPRFHQFPEWLKRFYPGALWEIPADNARSLYLSFDDGPHPSCTPWLLDLLGEYQAAATFFCSGKNVERDPALYNQIIESGHAVGNHGMHHPDGFRTSFDAYLSDVRQAGERIDSNLFRPPYGRISGTQFKAVKKLGYQVIFWSYMPYDFDASLPGEKRISDTIRHTHPGSILVFHDSEKAFPQLQQELPKLLRHWSADGYRFDKIKL